MVNKVKLYPSTPVVFSPVTKAIESSFSFALEVIRWTGDKICLAKTQAIKKTQATVQFVKKHKWQIAIGTGMALAGAGCVIVLRRNRTSSPKNPNESIKLLQEDYEKWMPEAVARCVALPEEEVVAPAPLPLSNFRSLLLRLQGKDIKVSGVAHPFAHGHDPKQVLQQLRASHEVLISLEVADAPAVKEIWQDTLKGTHHLIEVPDFKAPTPKQIAKINAIVAQAAKEGRSVAIHCEGGAGRTGTILAALKMQSMHDQGEKIDFRRSLVSMPSEEKAVTTSAFVKRAIDAIRSRDVERMSVEVQAQVKALEAFARQLIHREATSDPCQSLINWATL